MALSDYLALIPPPNSTQPNYMAWESANLQPIVDMIACLSTFNSAFNINTAVGSQLDTIGQVLQVSRTLNFQPGGGLSAVMTDSLYRIALFARILQNQWKGTIQEIYNFWQTYLPLYPVLIQDNQNMTMSVLVIGMPIDTTGAIAFVYDTPGAGQGGYDVGYWDLVIGVLRDMVLHGYFTPRPAGVTVNYSFLTTPVFSYDTESTYLKGYDESNWAANH